MKLDKFEETIFFATARITVSSHSDRSASVGTGFLFSAQVNESQRVILMISNRHVFGDSKQRMVINFHRAKPDKSGPDLGQIECLDVPEFSNVYYPHPNPSVDLACLNVSFIGNPENNVYYRTLWHEMFDFCEEDLLPGDEVWFVGYPENRFDIQHNLPILRRGYIASIPTIDFNGNKQFIIDAQVFPGSSGSPVFAAISGHFRLLGVVSQTMVRNEQLQPITVATNFGVQQILGLGIVTKGTLVKELVDGLVEKTRASLVQVPQATTSNDTEPRQESS